MVCMTQLLSFHEFLKKFPLRHYKKGDMIVCEGVSPSRSYAIKTGFVKVFLTTKNGEEKAVAFNAADDIVPLAWTFKKSETPLYYYQAFTDCEVYELPRESILEFTKQNPDIFRQLCNYLLDLDIDLKQHIHSLEQAKASDKIMHAFHFLARRFGEKLDNANVKMLLPLTQQDLANFLGLTRETTGAQLKDLQQKGVITYQQQQYIVHTDRLRAALES